MPRLKVLISGAGIAGNAVAFWLSKLGHDVTVIERFPSLRATGLQIDLRGHGVEVLKRMGLEQAFRSKSAPEQGVQLVDSSGRRRAYFPANKSGKGPQGFTTEFEIMRGALCRLIYDAVGGRAKYVFGTAIESFEEKDSSVEVRFTDGTTDCFDMLVGADGQGSRTRKMMLGPDATDAFLPFDGVYIGYFTIPRPMQDGEEYIATAYMAPGQRVIMTRRHNPNDIQAYLVCKTKSEQMKAARPGNVTEEKEALAEVFKGAGWQTEDILKALKTDNDFYCERLGIVKLDSWSRGRVVLVGDAAYGPSAATAMGTTCAMVGAYVLAGEIARHCGCADRGADDKYDIAAALKAFESNFQPYMEQVQEGVLEDTAFDRMPSTAFGVALLHFLVGVVSFLRLDAFGKYFVREKQIRWDLPEYKEMSQQEGQSAAVKEQV
ncbi:FAD/NAD(P)-binding domain-containing protein [Coniochaeta sp. PMI_546]|nr:FAD/NAD(P)-binding domain-containing protein [Coniochaeta sp. PMI_546]